MVEARSLSRLLSDHSVFAGFAGTYIELVAGCTANVAVPAGEYIYREGEPADRFYLIRHGRVALEVFVPGKSPIVVETLKVGDLLGFSWLLPPYRNSFDARAIDLTRLLSLDAACLRGKMEDDHTLGYELHKRFAPIIAARLAAARRQLIDMYGHPNDRGHAWP